MGFDGELTLNAKAKRSKQGTPDGARKPQWRLNSRENNGQVFLKWLIDTRACKGDLFGAANAICFAICIA
jgi:hypothetical protein